MADKFGYEGIICNCPCRKVERGRNIP